MPVAPSGEHHAPGYTLETPGVDETVVVVVDCTGVVALGVVALAGVVDDELIGVVVTVEATCGVLGLVVEDVGSPGHGAIVRPGHEPVSTFFTLPHSLGSIDRPQRAFTAIQFDRYVHKYDLDGGSQLLGSLSLLDWFTRSVTASRVRESDVSLAYARRMSLDHAQAPESHASFSATTWSMSMRDGSLHRAPS